jgi:hypothetical protein
MPLGQPVQLVVEQGEELIGRPRVRQVRALE